MKKLTIMALSMILVLSVFAGSASAATAPIPKKNPNGTLNVTVANVQQDGNSGGMIIDLVFSNNSSYRIGNIDRIALKFTDGKGREAYSTTFRADKAMMKLKLEPGDTFTRTYKVAKSKIKGLLGLKYEASAYYRNEGKPLKIGTYLRINSKPVAVKVEKISKTESVVYASLEDIAAALKASLTRYQDDEDYYTVSGPSVLFNVSTGRDITFYNGKPFIKLELTKTLLGGHYNIGEVKEIIVHSIYRKQEVSK